MVVSNASKHKTGRWETMSLEDVDRWKDVACDTACSDVDDNTYTLETPTSGAPDPATARMSQQ